MGPLIMKRYVGRTGFRQAFYIRIHDERVSPLAR